ncbi:hypothetical protein L2E82_10002 [Cichorium intybus]|uniref:Uncharacterized protein n=1 Tax=Cichorium intybus TaxID=13427 RepID=A0ACB9G9B3_CICIN|nr:hypothetical protein L2E82_10002 [Cichorium intybus]
MGWRSVFGKDKTQKHTRCVFSRRKRRTEIDRAAREREDSRDFAAVDVVLVREEAATLVGSILKAAQRRTDTAKAAASVLQCRSTMTTRDAGGGYVRNWPQRVRFLVLFSPMFLISPIGQICEGNS